MRNPSNEFVLVITNVE